MTDTNTGRSDYDHMIKMSRLEPGEPVFVIRARDRVSAATVRAWAALAHRAGSPDALIEQALAQADAMEAWPQKQVADANHLSEAEAQRLAFALSRRAWNARTQARPSPAELLAERRGYDLGANRVRRLESSMSLLLQALQDYLVATDPAALGTKTQVKAARARILGAIADASRDLEQLGDAGNG